MLLLSSSGCIGLLQGREYMEHLRGDVTLSSSMESTVIDHSFSSSNVDDLQFSLNEKFTVDSEVTKIGVYFKYTKAGGPIDDFLQNLGIIDPRGVDVEITDPSGNLKYNATLEKTNTAPYFLIQPEDNGEFISGEWNINIEATGGGIGTAQDNFRLAVDVTRTCTIYPQDDVCVVD
jgi:hypothetical protein